MKSTLHPFQTDDAKLRPIHEKVLAGQALDVADVSVLFTSADILAIGWLSNYIRERLHGNRTRAITSEINQANATHFAVTGDLNRVLLKVEEIRSSHPEAQIAAGVLEELVGKPRSFATLKAAGADALLGDDVTLFVAGVRRAVWNTTSNFQQRFEARHAAMDAGLQVPLYLVQRPGSMEQQAAELLHFRDEPAESFVAISYPADSSASLNLTATTGMREMKQIAIARLALPKVKHIRVFWQMLGGKLAQIALRFGASEIDGTSLDVGVNPQQRGRELAREVEAAGQDPHEAPAKRLAIVEA